MRAYLIVFFTAATKFLFAPFVGVNGLGLGVFETFIAMSCGGMFSAIIFYLLGKTLIKYSYRKKIEKFAALKLEGKPLPKKMTKTNKMVIKAKHLFGIWGLAFLTATFLSIPLGTIICVKFYRHKKSTIFIIFLFIIINSLILSLIAGLFPAIGG